ncbi:MAG: aminopeptidase [Proteobacteria bacterium]|nr:aminopeptidase [Pseudomonadota bacterium]
MLTETPKGTRCVLLALLCAGLAGCGTPYLMQAASGEWHVMHARRPLERVIADPSTPAPLRERLEQVREARAFAVSDLGLPDNASYRSYADIGRPYVVWNVVATPEFSVVPEHWCFPVAGCVAYRGYFHESAAERFAARLRGEGLDVAIDGVPAYSTLGKFADPVLSSMMRYGNEELVATIFHELAHQLLYVKDDSAFNEAFATTVEDAGLELWLAHRGTPARTAQYLEDQRREADFLRLLSAARVKLAVLYAGRVPVPDMRARKAQILDQLGTEIHEFEKREGVSYPLYDEWIRAGLNNARLASVATYYDCVPGFKRLLASEDGDLRRFYEAARRLAKLPRRERHAQLCGPVPAAPDEGSD